MSGAVEHKYNLGFSIFVFFCLLALTGLTILSSFANLGIWNTVVVLSIAFIKTALVLLVFMHLSESTGFIKMFIFGAFLWVGVMFAMTLNDFQSRDFIAVKLEPKTWINRSPHQFVDEPAVVASEEPSKAH